MYEIFNGVAHVAMILLVLEVLALLVLPALGIGLGGLFGLSFVRKRLPRWMPTVARLPRGALTMVDRACTIAAWPVIRCTSLWRGLKAGAASLRRQASRS